MYKLELYYFPGCPYCQRVLKVIERQKIKVDLKNTDTDPEAAKKLESDTGTDMVPCLYIDGKPMHESADIIKWLESNYKK